MISRFFTRPFVFLASLTNVQPAQQEVKRAGAACESNSLLGIKLCKPSRF